MNECFTESSLAPKLSPTNYAGTKKSDQKPRYADFERLHCPAVELIHRTNAPRNKFINDLIDFSVTMLNIEVVHSLLKFRSNIENSCRQRKETQGEPYRVNR